LDAFVGAGSEGNDRYQAAYGILCEFAHPNNRGMLGFLRSVEIAPVGWQLMLLEDSPDAGWVM